MPRLRFAVLATMLALALAAAGAATAAAAAKPKRQVPFGFMGVIADGPLDDPAVDPNPEFQVMALNGVETVRAALYWDLAQPYRKKSDVPPFLRGSFSDEGGVPTDFSRIDRFVAAAAFQGLRLMPVVVRAPAWARRHPQREWSPPSRPADYARFLRALIRRYGPSGVFWKLNPRLKKAPIREWQIWNEPEGPNFWDEVRPYRGVPSRAYPAMYVNLLRAAHATIKRADPRARVILAGIFGKGWFALGNLYDYDRRIGRYFDAVTLHPFTSKPENVKLTATMARRVMDRHGDRRKPLMVTEMGWPSAAGRPNQKLGFEVTEEEQARRLTRAYKLLSAARKSLRLERVIWHTWASDDQTEFTFHYAGLRRTAFGGFWSKPAFAAFRDLAFALEGCPNGKVSITRCR